MDIMYHIVSIIIEDQHGSSDKYVWSFMLVEVKF